MNHFHPVIPLLALAALVATPVAAEEDPWRGLNQRTHAFNEAVDGYVLEPVAKGYDFVVPDVVQTGVGNFFDNLLVPRTVINDLLQGDFREGARHTGRFLVNTVVGIGGLFDVADGAGLDHDREDFGQTLGRWGVGTGPYFVIPFLGPSTLRDTLALPADYAANPAFWVDEGIITGAATALDLTNRRAGALEEIAENRRTAIDFYVFVRDAYLQNREEHVTEGAAAADDDDDDLYDDEGL